MRAIVTRCARVTSILRLSPVTGSASETGTGPCRRAASSFANCAASAGKRELQAVSAAQRANTRSSARCDSMAIPGTSASAGGTTPSRMTVRVCSGIAARVVLRDARAVGAAEDVDLLRNRAPRARRRGPAPRCSSCRTAAGRAASQGTRVRARAVPRARSRRPRAHRPACRSRAGSSRPCRAGPRARGRARGGCRRRRRGSARKPSIDPWPGPARDEEERIRLRACVATAGTTATASSMRAPFGSSGSSGTESLPQRASVELSPSASAMRQGSSAISDLACSGRGPNSAAMQSAAQSTARETGPVTQCHARHNGAAS